jgi:eukaryotic-like serine/threonine-protein kinase
MGGRYRVLRRVARGGCANIYQAEDLVSNLPVAIKVPRFTNTTAIESSVAEGRLLSTIAHPHVPRVYGTLALSDGRVCVIMEWIEGASLEEFAKGTPISVSDALALTASIADVLAILHDRSTLHRDVKPLNILIPCNPVAQLQSAKLVDFNCARSMTALTELGHPSTDFGRQTGTFPYMAPEQLAGRCQTTATDIFGLGATLFFMLLGEPPMGDGAVEYVRPDIDGTAVPKRIGMGPFVVRRLTEDVVVPGHCDSPRGLRSLLVSMLQRDTAKRISSATVVRDRLRELHAACVGQYSEC